MVTAKTQARGMEKVCRRSLKLVKSAMRQKRRYSLVNGIGDNNNEQVLSDANKVLHMVELESKNGSNNIKPGVERPDMIALQETKSKIIDEEWIEEVWGSRNFGYVQKEDNGISGGLLLVWDSNIFVYKHGIGDERFVAVKGERKGVDGDIFFVCVYGPHVGQQKTFLWNRLLNLMEGGNEAWCLLGDFNDVRSEEDRKNT
ncbi:hypothetical protein CTI12_AA301890 [Artemisia annua]|uniref:Endonuclease/exonuclease/phosphatase domain-containing protein n=1 Tax=Artemisia annua TaxID=35608 RepID=A0A2U1N4R9_ARTAN|nr:hypothetical protein CTI12_AA301890 [Artemisia annua]